MATERHKVQKSHYLGGILDLASWLWWGYQRNHVSKVFYLPLQHVPTKLVGPQLWWSLRLSLPRLI